MEKRSGNLNREEFVIEIPDRIVGVLMKGAKDKNSVMNNLRRACHPADVWIPFRDKDADSCYRNSNAEILRKVIVKGSNLDIVNRARIILYKYIKNKIGFDILQMHPLNAEQIALEKPWLERYEYKIEGKSESKPRKDVKRPAKRCSLPEQKKRAMSGSLQGGSSVKSIVLRKEETDDIQSHILVTPQPWPRKTITPPEHPREYRSPKTAEGSLIVMSAVGTCDDDENEDIAKILELPC